MNTRTSLGLAAAGIAASLAFTQLYAQSTTPLVANAQFRRVVPDTDRSASGTVQFRVDSQKQTCTVSIKALGSDSFGLFYGATSIIDTSKLLYAVAPLDRTNLKHGNWIRKLTGTTQAPIEFPFSSLTNLAGAHLVIAQSNTNTFTTTLTNITAGVTNILNGATNVVGGVTNLIYGIPVELDTTGTVYATLWAPIPEFRSAPSSGSYSVNKTLLRPTPLPAPNATARFHVAFNAAQGRSVIDIHATNLNDGQIYTLYITDSTSSTSAAWVPAGSLVPMNKGGSSQRYLRDTKFGDPLPLQARDVVDLRGHAIQIRDNLNFVYLEGIMP